MPVISAFWRVRQEYCKVEVSLDYMIRPCQKRKLKTKNDMTFLFLIFKVDINRPKHIYFLKNYSIIKNIITIMDGQECSYFHLDN
jgi:hypothetical protein